MRSIWKGALSFGLVNVPVKLYSATEDHDVGLHQVHDADGGRIHYERRCDVCGKIVPYAHIDKAYDDGERTVVLTADDLAAMPAERSREIEVVEFVPNEQIDPIMFDKSYFLEPDGASPKAYVLLRRTLESTDRTAIVRFALRQKTRLAALRVRGDVLVLQTLLWSDEVREAAFPALDETVRISSKELELSSSLVDSYASDFTPDEFVDEYQKELRLLIERKLEQGDAIDTEATFGEVPEKEEGGGEVIDLMDALRRSVESARGSKSGDAKKSSGAGAAAKKGSGSSGSSSSTGSSGSSKASASKKAAPKKATASRKTSAKSDSDSDAAPKRKAQ
ncbi:MAG: Ku protein [Leifsonia flava]